MARLGLETEIIDQGVFDKAVERFREAKIVLPTFAELEDPSTIPSAIQKRLADVDPDEAHPLNLFRVHWYNDAQRRGLTNTPAHLVLPEELTGVKAKIIVALGNRFPMINAHKVLAAYGCLAPRIVTGQFDPQTHKALWPSTGNYCRGGVAISRIMNCHGVAILPEGMSAERFNWLDKWALDPQDIIRTTGCESNVKEIYDKCNELDRSPENIIFNQFCEFGNHLVHYACTGKALEKTFAAVSQAHGGLNLRAFVSSTGSAGTIAAGDHLKDIFGSKIVATEALECPTLLFNGFGDHNIQGIGDKHIPLIHNVMNTDLVAAISDRATDSLGLLFNSDAGRDYLLQRRGISKAMVDSLAGLGLSSICNVLAAIKTARYYQLGADEAVITVATDDATMYGSEREKANLELFNDSFDQIHAAEVFGQHLLGQEINHLAELNHLDKHRVFNLGYFTWVEQQGVSLEEFNARRSQKYWQALRPLLAAWDTQIGAFNDKTGVLASL